MEFIEFVDTMLYIENFEIETVLYERADHTEHFSWRAGPAASASMIRSQTPARRHRTKRL